LLSRPVDILRRHLPDAAVDLVYLDPQITTPSLLGCQR